MSQSPTPPPPPTGPPPAGDQPPVKPAEEQIKPPAIALLVTGILGLILACINLISNIIGVGSSGAQIAQDAGSSSNASTFVFITGTAGVIGAIIGVIGGAFVIFGSLKMLKLEGFSVAMATAIVAMVPFVSPCCLLGIPFGIWALVVLNKPEVKAGFVG